ncbi:MAG: non-canonical purine NTP pyrophosphatase [Alphaproteobacteria bacterium]
MELYFITSNLGKAQTLQKSFEIAGYKNIKIIQKDMNLMEPQADTVAEVSKFKAEQAYKILKAPLLVEDGSFCVEALEGFPGVYTKYVLETIGVKELSN